MKKIFTLLLAALLGGIAAQAQEADYQPLVREGVRWVNNSQFVYFGDETYYGPVNTYVMQFAADTVITTESGTHIYKKLVTSSDNYFLREEGRKVYRLHQRERDLDVVDQRREYLLYDFSGESQATLCGQATFNYEGTIEIDGHPCRVFHDISGNHGHLVESVGLVSGSHGDLIDQRWGEPAGGDYYYGIEHLEDLDGNTLYLPPWKTVKPLVREGVRWIYRKNGHDDSPTYYAIEFEGDTVIDPSNMPYACSYKKCYRFVVDHANMHSPVSHDGEIPTAYMRNHGVSNAMITHETVERHTDGFPPESYIYSFQCPCRAYLMTDNSQLTFNLTENANIAGLECRVYAFDNSAGADLLVESVGLVSASHGDLLGLANNENPDEECGLSHVIDADGNIIYKGPCYSENVSIGQVLGDKSQPADPRWYDLLGRPHETRPTQPGIYIHQGRKVVVK